MIVDRINAYLATAGQDINQAILTEVGKLAVDAFSRQFGKRENKEMKNPWFSSIGKCMRQQAYKLLGFPEDGKAIDARAKMVFFMGDLAEIAIIQVAKAAGCEISASGKDQERIEIFGVTGKADGVLWEEEGGYLIEAKSMSSFAFRDFERGILDEGYRYQVNAGMAALKLSQTIVVGLNKDAGVLAEQIVSINPEIVKDIEKRSIILKNLNKDKLPDRAYATNEKGFYPWNCLYCGFHRTCLPNAEKVVVSKKYKLKEKPKNATTP